MTRGKFIVLEGIDRSGKTYLSKQISSYIHSQNFECNNIAFPMRTTSTGILINHYLTNNKHISTSKADARKMHLLFSANRWECADEINRALSCGNHIVCDRYYISGAAYTAARGIDLQWALSVDESLPQPDVVIYIDVPPEVAAARGGYGNEVYETIEFQRKVAQKYKEVFELTKDKLKWVIIDGTKPLEEVKNIALAVVDNLLKL